LAPVVREVRQRIVARNARRAISTSNGSVRGIPTSPTTLGSTLVTTPAGQAYCAAVGAATAAQQQQQQEEASEMSEPSWFGSHT
jgi:hypothetical protein